MNFKIDDDIYNFPDHYKNFISINNIQLNQKREHDEKYCDEVIRPKEKTLSNKREFKETNQQGAPECEGVIA